MNNVAQMMTAPGPAPLTEKAMLALLSISCWGAKKKAKNVAQEAADKHGAKVDRLTAQKALVAKESLEKIKAIESEAREYHRTHTRPWLDEGSRILPAALFWEYQQEMARLRMCHESEVALFLANYPILVIEAVGDLGNLHDADDYPAPDKIAERFGFKTSVRPLPSGDDFRVQLGAEEEARIRAQINADLQEGVSVAMKDLWAQVHGAVSHMATKLRAYKPADKDSGTKAEGIFRDSMVDNLREIVGLLPAMNIAGDAQLEALRLELERSLVVHDAEQLRESDQLRETVATSAEDILARMAGYIGG